MSTCGFGRLACENGTAVLSLAVSFVVVVAGRAMPRVMYPLLALSIPTSASAVRQRLRQEVQRLEWNIVMYALCTLGAVHWAGASRWCVHGA